MAEKKRNLKKRKKLKKRKQKRKINGTIVSLILVLLILIALILLLRPETVPGEKVLIPILSDAHVTEVVDGDTFVIENGEYVRLIGVDTPESYEESYEEAKIYLENLILDKDIKLISDLEDRDRYGRLLRYAYVQVEDKLIFVNSNLVLEGYAGVFFVDPNVLYRDTIEKAYENCLRVRGEECGSI